MYSIGTYFKIFLFIPVLAALLINTGCIIFGVLFIILVGNHNIVLFSEIYIGLVVLINIALAFIVMYLSNKFIRNNMINALNDFYQDMQHFYKSNQDDFTSWSQKIITSPQEVVEISRYFHNNIAKKIYDLDYRINHDPLTGLRTYMTLRDDLAKYQNHVIAVINISNFREINSFYGLELADKILASVASILKNYFKGENYLLYRIAGDDFAILWVNYTDKSIFVKKLDDFLEYLGRKEILIDGYTYINLTATIGIAFSYDSAKYSMINALMALHHAKEYKNPIVIYNKHLPTLSVLKNNIQYTEIIYYALKNQDIIPFYQRIEAIQDSLTQKETKHKYEALMRIKDKDNHIVPPSLFLEIAKRSNAYLKLSKLMIEKSFAFLSTRDDLIFSVNLSLEDMSSPEFSVWFMDRIVRYNLEGRVVVEITEQESIENFDSVSSFVANVKELGVKIALDDFGSGYSNFSILMQLQIDYLKIDGSLIKNIDKDKNAKIIVETIVGFAKLLNIYTISEFVSSKEVYDVVKEIGVDYAQGYYVGKPLQNI